MDILHRSQSFSRKIYTVIYGRSAPTSLRGSIAGGSFDAVLEHHRSIILLVERRFVGSAFSLLRPMFDGCITGLWATYLATESELERFEQDRLTIKPVSVIRRLRPKDDGDYVVTLQSFYDKTWKPMSNYVHGGNAQVARRNAPEYIGPNYSPEDIEDVLTFANAFALIALMEIPSFSEDPSFAEEVKRIAQGYVDGQG